MKNPTANVKNELKLLPQTPNQKGIANHHLLAKHLDNAAKKHREAAQHHEEDNHDKAAKSTMQPRAKSAWLIRLRKKM